MTGEDRPTIVILGAGAMGGLFGGLLHEGGLDVTLVDTRRDHVDAIRRDGLKIVGHGGDRSIGVPATTEVSTVERADVVLVQCKAMHSVAAVTAARHLFQVGDTFAVSFQNGLGNEETIGQVIGMDRVMGGLTAQGATVVGPGVVRNFGDLPTYVGEMAGGLSPRGERLAAAFTKAGLRTSASDDIVLVIWKKLLANIALSALSGATDLNATQTMAIPEMRATALRAVDEAAAVAQAAGIALDAGETREILLQLTGKGGTGAAKSSLCTDILNRRPTEVDTIYGRVVALGRVHGVPTPTLDTLVSIVKGLESHYLDHNEGGTDGC
jgi:2-dehydropantoate 2-reductase